MRSIQMTKRYYHDDENNENAPVYYLMRNIPDPWDDENFNECYSIIARYANGDVSQWFFPSDDLKSAFRVYRIMSINRHM